jgi:hypothetical protein
MAATENKLSAAEIVDALVKQTTRELGRDAEFIRDQIGLRRRDGDPNWDANIGLAPPTVLAAFGRALNLVSAGCNLE